MGLSKHFLLVNLIAILISFCFAAETKCEIGTFLSRGKCKLCPPGTFQNKKGATACIPCPPGFFNQYKGAPGHDICKPCKAGTFSTVEAATSRAVCKPCPAGKHSPEGADRCLSCPAGSIISKCPNGHETYPDATNHCYVCENGYCERRRVELKCRKCNVGSFSPKNNSLECQFCPDDTIIVRKISEAGSSKCKNCPPGQGEENFNGVCGPCNFFDFNDGTNGICQGCPNGFQGNKKVGATKCVPCPAGTSGFGNCEKCKKGENTLVTGATFCAPDNTPCASNFFRNSRGACERCSTLKRYNKSKNKCEPCGKNEVSKGGVDTRCTKCPAGEIAVDFMYADDVDTDGKRCDCKAGMEIRADGKCVACPPGWHRDLDITRGDSNEGASCQECYPGSFAPRSGTAICLPCPKGTAQPLWGQSKCVKCSRGLQPNTGSVNDRAGEKCVNPATGCPKDTKRENDGDDFSCPTVGGDDGTRPSCERNERYVPKTNECVRCRNNFSNNVYVSKGGKSQKCKKCDGIYWTSLSGCQCVSAYFDARELVKGKCQICPSGTYGRNGVPGCKPCPAGTFRNKSVFWNTCQICGPGTFSNPGAEKCTRCPKGTNSFGVGFASCVKPGSLK